MPPNQFLRRDSIVREKCGERRFHLRFRPAKRQSKMWRGFCTARAISRAQANASDSLDLAAVSAVRRGQVWWVLGIKCRNCDRVYEARLEVVARGGGCFICKGSHPLGKEEFIRRSQLVHSDIYDYSNVVYVSKNTPVLIGCAVHGAFLQVPAQHMKGTGCAKCLPVQTLKTNLLQNLPGLTLFPDLLS